MSEATSANATRDSYAHPPPDRLDDLSGVGAGNDYHPERFEEDDPDHGAGWPTAGTRPRMADADEVVTDRDDLVRALDAADPGDLIFVPGRATIDLTGVHEQDVGAPNVTLASDRGPDSDGAKLEVTDSTYMREKTVRRVFDVTRPGFRVTGLRLIGPQTTFNEWEGYEEDRPMCGLSLNADGVEVDNLVGRGWGHAVINCGRNGWIEQPHVHHCEFVDNPQDALGYGVASRHAKPLIQYCYFDNNRHSVAGSGHEDCSYVFRYNLIGPHGILHALDMHERESDDGSTRQAGRRISIHHNEVMFSRNSRTGSPEEAIKIRGIPAEGAQICHNRFHHPSDRYSEHDLGDDGDVVLLELDGSDGDPSTLHEAGVDVYDNVSTQESLDCRPVPPVFDAEDA